MRQLIIRAFNVSLDGVSAEYGTDYFNWCMAGIDPRIPSDAHTHIAQETSVLDESHELYRNASAYVVGRVSYQNMYASFGPNGRSLDHPWARSIDAAEKLVFSRTLAELDWPGARLATGDVVSEVTALKESGEGHILAYGGLTLWQQLLRADLVDVLALSLLPYVAGEGRRLFDNVGQYGALELSSSTVKNNGSIDLEYHRKR